jgi:hypothetical protein
MQRSPVGSSSNVVSAGYSNGTLEIEFKGSRVYHHSDVSPDIYAGLMSAASPGQYVNQNIAWAYSYSQGEAPSDLLEDITEGAAEELPEVAELAATIAAPETRAASWLMRFGSALRRMMPF